MKSSYMKRVSSRSAMRTALASKKRAAPLALAEYQDKIRTAGLRSTAPRVAVLRELEAATSPLSHADLVDSLGSQGYDRVTIYRNLTDLTEAGLVVRADLGDHVWRFELRREGREHAGLHPHFTCTDCGTVSCLPEASVRISSAKGAPKSISARAVEVQLRGLCDHCA